MSIFESRRKRKENQVSEEEQERPPKSVVQDTKDGFYLCTKGNDELTYSYFDSYGANISYNIQLKEGEMIFWVADRKHDGVFIYKVTHNKSFINRVRNLLKNSTCVNRDCGDYRKIIDIVRHYFKVEDNE